MEGQMTLFKGHTDTPHPKARERPEKKPTDGDRTEERTRRPFIEGDRIRSIRVPEKTGTVIMVSLVTDLLRVLWDGDPEPDFIERGKAEHIEEGAGNGRKTED